MEVLAAFLIAFAFLTTITPLKDVPESQVNVYQYLSKNLQQTQHYYLKSFTEFKNQNIVKQEYDYSCGSASLATLLNAYLGEMLSEQQVIQGMMEYGDSKLIEERRAFSLLDMKQFVTVLGYHGAGFTAELEDLTNLNKPCIIPIEFYGYKHFVVYRGMYKDHVFFADPFMGNISFPITEFKQMWSKNIVFIVTANEEPFNALRLKDEDLRLVSIKSENDFWPQPGRSDLVETEQKFMKSIGRTDTSKAYLYQYVKNYIK